MDGTQLAKIWTLKPNVTRGEAVETFRGRGLAALMSLMRNGPLRAVADVYVPYRLYRVQLAGGATMQTHWFALDAVDGSLDLYEYPRVPNQAEMICVETRNRPEAWLAESRGRELLKEKILRLVFQRGFFRAGARKIVPELEPVELHLPYWLGFYSGGGGVRCRVVDAVRRRVEGAKARSFFETWLTA